MFRSVLKRCMCARFSCISIGRYWNIFMYHYRSILVLFVGPVLIVSDSWWQFQSIVERFMYKYYRFKLYVCITDLTNTVWMMSSKTRSHLVHALWISCRCYELWSVCIQIHRELVLRMVRWIRLCFNFYNYNINQSWKWWVG